MIDILQTSTGDVELSDDLIRTEATEQHKRDLLLASQGDFKEAPTVGVDWVSIRRTSSEPCASSASATECGSMPWTTLRMEH